MRQNKILFLSFIFFALFFTSCKSENEKIDLTSGWTYSLSESQDFQPLDNSKLSNLETLVPKNYGFIWLKKSFTVPVSLKGQNLGVYLGRISIADETYLNGAFIGGEGRFPDKEFSAWNTARE